MNEFLKSATGEQNQTPKTTDWDTLANPNESWEEHLRKVEELKRPKNSYNYDTRGAYVEWADLPNEQDRQIEKENAKNEAIECLNTGDIANAKKNICIYAFGEDIQRLSRDLIATGAINLPQEDWQKIREDQMGRNFSEFLLEGNSGAEVGDLQRLIDSGVEISDEDEYSIEQAVDLFNADDSSVRDILGRFIREGTASTEKIQNLLRDARSKLGSRASELYSGYMQDSLRESSREIGTIHFVETGADIPVLEMQGDSFAILAHEVGGVIKGGDYSLDPADWKNRQEKGLKDKDGNSLDHISTSLIGNSELYMVSGKAKEETDNLVYGFSDLDGRKIKYISEYDAWAVPRTELNKTGQPVNNVFESDIQDYFEMDPKNLVNKTRERIEKGNLGGRFRGKPENYNEVVLDNTDTEKGPLTPTHIITFTNDVNKISDLQKRHAAYFGVPILMIDPKKYG